MLSQVLVAAGVSIVCGGLGVTEWLRSRAVRTATVHHPRPVSLRVDDATPMYDRVTRLTALTGFRLSVRDEDDDVWSLARRS